MISIDHGLGVLYRFERYSVGYGCDEDGYCRGSTTKVRLDEYGITKRTPKGAWVDYFSNPSCKKFVNLTSRKQFASETIEQAKGQFIHRTNRYLKILVARTETATHSLRIIDGACAKELHKREVPRA